MTECFVYNPEAFDPLDILPKPLHKFADDARYFVHKIYEHRVFRRRCREDFVPLKSEYLTEVMSERKYTTIRTHLLTNGVVLSDGYWIRGRKAIGYRLGDALNKSKHRKIILSNPRIIKKLAILEENLAKSIKLDTHKHLHKYLKQVGIDYESAVMEIDDDFNSNELSAAMIRDKAFFFKPDIYGRVHTNLSNLKSSLRKHLTWNGEHLWNVDIANSQPLFFGLLLLYWYTNKGYLNSFNLPPLILPLRSDILPSDVDKFVKLVEMGKLYEYIAVKGKIETESRKILKKKLFAEIFFCRNKPYQSKNEILFEGLFPEVYKVIRELKKKDYTFLSKQLQRVESSFVINLVVRRCMNEHPDMPIFTIHDSVMTTKANADIVKGIMVEEFANYGVEPKLRLESC